MTQNTTYIPYIIAIASFVLVMINILSINDEKIANLKRNLGKIWKVTSRGAVWILAAFCLVLVVPTIFVSAPSGPKDIGSNLDICALYPDRNIGCPTNSPLTDSSDGALANRSNDEPDVEASVEVGQDFSPSPAPPLTGSIVYKFQFKKPHCLLPETMLDETTDDNRSFVDKHPEVVGLSTQEPECIQATGQNQMALMQN